MKLSKGSELLIDESGKLADLAVLKAGTLLFDDLNEHPTVVLSVDWWWKGCKTNKSEHCNSSPASSLRNWKMSPCWTRWWLLCGVWAVSWFAAGKAKQFEDLLQYTKEHVKPINFNHPKRPKDTSHKAKIPTKENVFEFASFPTEIDLHIEKLYRTYSKTKQYRYYKNSTDGFWKVLSKGKKHGHRKVLCDSWRRERQTKEEIWKELDASADVLSYKNEYHHKYGYGATEVVIDYR